MRKQVNINNELYDLIELRGKQLNISVDEFINIACQNLYNMSKNGLPTANDIYNFKYNYRKNKGGT